MATEAFAPAKINLALHVTGRRGDGYHLLDSLVAFADVGDRILADCANDLTLTMTGPYGAKVPVGADNLVLRAAALFGRSRGATLTLDKQLPVASGIGGGSADAAATLHALSALWSLPLPSPSDVLSLGADVPACLDGRSLRMTGMGERLHPLAYHLPAVALVLVNPGVALSTAAVFAALDRRDHGPMPRDLPRLQNVAELAAFLGMMRNDLEAPALTLAPVIAQVNAALSAQPGCRIARMSGSGATCFGLFADPLTASAAADAIRSARRDWWVASAPLRI